MSQLHKDLRSYITDSLASTGEINGISSKSREGSSRGEEGVVNSNTLSALKLIPDSSIIFALLTLAVVLATGCSKKAQPEPTDTSSPAAAPAPAPALTPESTETIDDARSRLLNQLKSTGDRRLDAVEELSVWAETDSRTVEALIALLKDKSTAGSGKTHPMRITSTREAAARALSLAGPKGEAALKEKGFARCRPT
jgi:hypothetical protein